MKKHRLQGPDAATRHYDFHPVPAFHLASIAKHMLRGPHSWSTGFKNPSPAGIRLPRAPGHGSSWTMASRRRAMAFAWPSVGRTRCGHTHAGHKGRRSHGEGIGWREISGSRPSLPSLPINIVEPLPSQRCGYFVMGFQMHGIPFRQDRKQAIFHRSQTAGEGVWPLSLDRFQAGRKATNVARTQGSHAGIRAAMIPILPQACKGPCSLHGAFGTITDRNNLAGMRRQAIMI